MAASLAALPIWLMTPSPTLAGDAAATPTVADVAELDIAELVKLRVSPFDVATTLDSGYRASNSVSGSRFDAPIRELPFAIQAFTESFIEDQKPRNIFDVARYSPGVTYRSNDFNEGNANLAIRGFAVSAAPGNVQILRDGFHGPSIFEFTNISRVEVVKGPASFLYGQLAPGGIVNVITKSPESRFAARADASYGSYSEYRVAADVTGPAARSLFYRIDASYDQDMHYWEPYDAQSQVLAPSLLWQPSERISVSLKYEYYRKVETPQLMQKPGYNTQAGLVPTAADPNRSGVDVPGLPDNWNSMANSDYRRSNSDNLSAWADIKADDHWNLRAGYSHLKYDVDALWSGNLGMANNTTLLQGRRVRRQVYSNWDDSLEVQGVGRYALSACSLRLLIGGQFVNRRFDAWAAQAPNDPTLGSNPIASPLPLWNLADPATWDRNATVSPSAFTANASHTDIDHRDHAIYGGSTFGFFEERLLLLAGWRQTSTASRLEDRLSGTSQPTIHDSAVTPQYGILGRLTPGISLFASYAESFVPGFQVLRNPDGSTTTPRPTEGHGWDLGLKAELLEGRVSGTITAFDIRNRHVVNDLAVTDTLGNVTIYNVQSGQQRSRGVELDATLTPNDRWQIYLSYSVMRARIAEFSGNDASILAEDPTTLDAAARLNYKNVLRFHDAPLQMSAPHLANLWTRYSFGSDPRHGAYVGGGFNFVGDQTLLPDTPASAYQTYTLVNAMAGYAWTAGGRQMNLDFSGKNLTNEHYRPSQSSRGRPREYQLTFSLRY